MEQSSLGLRVDAASAQAGEIASLLQRQGQANASRRLSAEELFAQVVAQLALAASSREQAAMVSKDWMNVGQSVSPAPLSSCLSGR